MATTVTSATPPELSQTLTQQVPHSVVGVEPVRALPDTVHTSHINNLVPSEDHTLMLCTRKIELGAIKKIDHPLDSLTKGTRRPE